MASVHKVMLDPKVGVEMRRKDFMAVSESLKIFRVRCNNDEDHQAVRELGLKKKVRVLIVGDYQKACDLRNIINRHATKLRVERQKMETA